MAARRLVGAGQLPEAPGQLAHRLQRRVPWRRALLPAFGQALGGQSGETGAQVQRGFVAQRPVAQLLAPVLVIARLDLAPVDDLVRHRLIQQLADLVGPFAPAFLERLERPRLFLQGGIQQRRQAGFAGCGALAEQRPHAAQQVVGMAPAVHHPAQCIALQRIAVQPPVVARHLGEQFAVVGFQGQGEQAAAVEGVLAQHALAPAVDGGNGGLVHPLRGDVQAAGAGRPALGREVGAQLAQQVVTLRFLAKDPRRLHQPRTDAVAQLAGGGVGEGHHEDFRRQQFAGESLLAAVTEHQAQIKRRDGEGLAGTGAGLDQAAAVQREAQCQGTGVCVHAWACSLSAANRALSSDW